MFVAPADFTSCRHIYSFRLWVKVPKDIGPGTIPKGLPTKFVEWGFNIYQHLLIVHIANIDYGHLNFHMNSYIDIYLIFSIFF